MSIAATLLPEFDQEMANTRKLLACYPEGKGDWKPHEKSMALGRLAGHVAELPSWAVNAIKLDSLDVSPQPGKPMQAPTASTREELLKTFDGNVVEARAAIAGASDQHLAQTWTLVFQGKTMFAMPRTAVLRGPFMNHLIHHRAQLGVYLRLNDVAIPGMYGPSADEAQWWKAAGK